MGGKKPKQKKPKSRQYRPVVGFDIGYGSIKVLQTSYAKRRHLVQGYGSTFFDVEALANGEITNVETVAKAAKNLFSHHLKGKITTRDVAVCLPSSATYSRIISIPETDKKALADAVRNEAEQYIPIAPDKLVLDYDILQRRDGEIDLLIAGAPKNVIDSYMELFSVLNLNVLFMEPSILSVARLVQQMESTDMPTVVIDMGSIASDLIVYSPRGIRVAGTVRVGGQQITQHIVDSLNVTNEQANIIKTKYGILASKKQAQILDALQLDLKQIVDEVRKLSRYLEDHQQEKNPIGQVILLGGGANMPGVTEFLTDHLRLPVRLSNSWDRISFGDLAKPDRGQVPMFATAAGLSLANPKEDEIS